jgi:hypothetical protein
MKDSTRVAAALLLAALWGCSGGGGGGDGGGGGGTAPLQYTGNTSPANISESNAALLAAAATNSAGTAEITGVVSSTAPGGGSHQGEGIVDVGRRLAHRVRKLGARPTAEARLTSAPFGPESGECPQGGTLTISGDVTPSGTGFINFTFNNCGVDGDFLTGTLTVRVDATLLGPGPDDILFLDSTLTVGRLSLRGSVNIDTGGTIRVQVNVPENEETITQNLVALNLDWAHDQVRGHFRRHLRQRPQRDPDPPYAFDQRPRIRQHSRLRHHQNACGPAVHDGHATLP